MIEISLSKQNLDQFPKADVINMRKGTLFGRIGFGPNVFMVNGNQWKLQRRVR